MPTEQFKKDCGKRIIREDIDFLILPDRIRTVQSDATAAEDGQKSGILIKGNKNAWVVATSHLDPDNLYEILLEIGGDYGIDNVPGDFLINEILPSTWDNQPAADYIEYLFRQSILQRLEDMNRCLTTLEIADRILAEGWQLRHETLIQIVSKAGLLPNSFAEDPENEQYWRRTLKHLTDRGVKLDADVIAHLL